MQSFISIYRQVCVHCPNADIGLAKTPVFSKLYFEHPFLLDPLNYRENEHLSSQGDSHLYIDDSLIILILLL